MSGKSRTLRRKIERLRAEMMFAYMQNGEGLCDEEVLVLSQRLDELLNDYEKCLKEERASIWVSRFHAHSISPAEAKIGQASMLCV
ncbi:Spo0E family sporulation regulatory protein-aspartic acid phosphatase [Cohnella soli]|uniref:Spo0E family sporulation regulatory protein-aspartic acid phosphatase n=1 Tax=Cohnella soli TaxID=425005 RepID=A0ABW0HZI4_9BACL